MTEDRYPTCSNSPPEDPSGGFFLTEQETAMKSSHLMSESEMIDAINAMAKKIVDEAGDEEEVILFGIKTRGVPLAELLGKSIEGLNKKPVLVGSLDIKLYRDDLSEVDEYPVVKKTDLPFAIEGKGIILVDDVLYTGRTIRAAMDALIDFGRPKYIRLAVMIDRGFRELPIQADYVGKTIKTTAGQNVKVMFPEFDGKMEVVIKG